MTEITRSPEPRRRADQQDARNYAAMVRTVAAVVQQADLPTDVLEQAVKALRDVPVRHFWAREALLAYQHGVATLAHRRGHQ